MGVKQLIYVSVFIKLWCDRMQNWPIPHPPTLYLNHTSFAELTSAVYINLEMVFSPEQQCIDEEGGSMPTVVYTVKVKIIACE